MSVIFDIETGPQSDDVIEQAKAEFEKTWKPPGNVKKPEKIAEKKDEALAKVVEKAALEPWTAKVLAIGYFDTSKFDADDAYDIDIDEEDVLLVRFWKKFTQAAAANTRMIGHFSNTFDLPFLTKRSFIVGVPVPANVWDPSYRYPHKLFFDTNKLWGIGSLGPDFVKLESLCKQLGVPLEKNGDGKDFAETLKNDPDAAIAYLRNDLDMTLGCAKRLQLI